MASVTFNLIIISLTSDPSKCLAFDAASSRNWTLQTPGEDRMYGNGRYNGLTAGAGQKQVPLTLLSVDIADVRTLMAWSGQQVDYRDDLGEKFTGSFRSPQVNAYTTGRPRADVSLTVTEQTHSDLL